MVYQLSQSTSDCKTGSCAIGGDGDPEDHPLGVVSMILMAILAPMAAMVVQMAISRSRDYAADKGGAEICGQPLALAKIAGEAHRMPNYEAGGHPATAHMFIINPLSGARMDNLFSTHPATETCTARTPNRRGWPGPEEPRRGSRRARDDTDQ